MDDVGLSGELRDIAVEVASDAAAFVAGRCQDISSVARKSSATDLVTDVDRETEARLVASIHARRPLDSILGEEGGLYPARNDGRGRAPSDAPRVQWVIDPIDGTVNFVLGLPAFSVSVAARCDGVTLAGCVVDVSRGESFHAHLGGGSRLSAPGRPDVPLRGPRSVALPEAVVGTGFAYDAGLRVRQGRVVAELLGRVGNVRRLGSAALDLAYVAAGRLDAYFEAGLNEWDRAAGMLVAAEAGAGVASLPGAGGEVTVAASAALYAEFVSLLTELGAQDVLAPHGDAATRATPD